MGLHCTIVFIVNYKRNSNVVFSCKCHVVWCPKSRRSVLLGWVAERLKQIIKEGCRERDHEIISYEIMRDHIHLLVEVDPQFGIHRLVKQPKGRSSNF
jgi:putative transposase